MATRTIEKEVSNTNAVRVLHVATMLRSGGVERWLVDLCSDGRAFGLEMDVAVLSNESGVFARKAKELGINVYHCPAAGNPLRFISCLRRLIRERGPYNAMHAHLHAYSGFAVVAARIEGVSARVVHSHNVVQNSSKSLIRKTYIRFSRFLISRFATAGLAPSVAAAEDLFGKQWQRDPRWRVMRCGIDLDPFRSSSEAPTRSEFGIPPDALVLGSVGRLTAEKNSEFLVAVLAEVLRRDYNAYLLLVGEGPLRERLESKAQQQGFRDRLILAGTRLDVPKLLRNVVDVFVFPSPPPPRGNEALGIAAVEAQAAGCVTVISDGIPPEAIVVPELVVQVRSDAGSAAWADAIIDQASRATHAMAETALAKMEHSDFNCRENLRFLAGVYRSACTV